jgi:hypothetical protein
VETLIDALRRLALIVGGFLFWFGVADLVLRTLHVVR